VVSTLPAFIVVGLLPLAFAESSSGLLVAIPVNSKIDTRIRSTDELVVTFTEVEPPAALGKDNTSKHQSPKIGPV